MRKKRRITAICKGKCPGCQEGSIFAKPLFVLKSFAQMHPKCPKCDASFMPEPGFYFGALYLSYAFSVALFVTVYVATYVLFDPPDWTYAVAIISSSFLFIPVSFRCSRIIWLYWFGGVKKRV